MSKPYEYEDGRRPYRVIGETARPLPEGFVPLTRYFYPSQRAGLPRHCGHCGTRLLIVDAPTAEHPIADHACWSCSRIQCELVHDCLRPRPRTAVPRPRPGRPPKVRTP